MIKNLQITIILFFLSIIAFGQSRYELSGTVIDAVSNDPIPGALIRVHDSPTATVSNADGNFELSLEPGKYPILISFIGYQSQMINLEIPYPEPLVINLAPQDIDLEGVEIFSTGFQTLSKERATGSFVAIDNELVNRRVSTNILDRLEDITSGLIFNRAGATSDPISIRGRSTIFANAQPLIVIDNFPYDGPLENINPNDVESMTVLRDAAAASIWGARAGNGVIVITTKSGKQNQKQRISFNINTNIIESPDLFYEPIMSGSELVDVHSLLFSRGVFANNELSPFRFPLPPAVETLIAARDGIISEEQKLMELDAFRANDSRRDLEKYFYRPAVNQQYALNFTGGSINHGYAFSVGYDNNREPIVGNHNDRLTLNSRNNWKLFSEKLSVDLGIYYTQTGSFKTTDPPGPLESVIYERLSDGSGMPLPIVRGYSTRFVNSLDDRLLDWRYFPLEEIGALDHRNSFRDIRLNAGLSYKINEDLKIEALHQFWQGVRTLEEHSPINTYFTRNLINLFTQTLEDGGLLNAVPVGDILQWGLSQSKSHNFRSQIHYNKSINDHEITALGGFEIKDWVTEARATRFYGYNRDLGTNLPVDFANLYRNFHFPLLQTRIPSGESSTGTTERFVSYYMNAAYHFKRKYGISASARRDASNLFGVETNQKAVPLWSVGGSWILSEERFFSSSIIDFLKFRTTYGYNGNVDRTVSSLTTALFFGGGANRLTGLPFAQVSNPPNPNLRWERIAITNLGLDFAAFSDKIFGNIEYYRKRGSDLIGVRPFPSSSGVSTFRGNFAGTKTTGIDLVLNSLNINTPNFSWNTTFLYSWINEKVTSYDQESPVLTYMSLADGSGPATPLMGRPLFSVYSFPWGGLDPSTGQPMGILNGEPSTDYGAIISSTSPENMIFHGSARPTHFGAVRNDLNYKGFSLSVNVAFRLGYYFRNRSVDYNELLNGRITHADFSERWQGPGDELITYVPAFPDGLNPNRDNIYRFSSIHVERGDHFRLQDIRFSYSWPVFQNKSVSIKNAEVYAYANNLGIIWKATKAEIDPDFPFTRPLRSIAFGFRLSL